MEKGSGAPADRAALRLRAAELRRLGRDSEAARAELEAIRGFAGVPALARAAQAIATGQLAAAERLLRLYLAEVPDDAAALLMLADVATAMGFFGEAERLLRQALELAPDFLETRQRLASVLLHQNRVGESIAMLDEILRRDPAHRFAAVTRAATLGQIGDYEEAALAYREQLERAPGEASLWTAYGHVLKTMGRTDESIGAYRRALGLNPASGETWWSLANLKTVRMGESETEALRSALQRTGIGPSDRFHLHFALGKALEDSGAFEESFRHYAEGNRLRRAALPYDPSSTRDEVRRWKALLTPSFLADRHGLGAAAPDPIFVLGMPRAGSTLVEQILASHPAVEGTSELPHIPILIQRVIEQGWCAGRRSYPELTAQLAAVELEALGRAYLDAATLHRKSGRPRFIDKLPNNWLNTGFIHLILPEARIVDVRRDPLSCGFSNFKQHFAKGQAFSYELEHIGAYYRDYVELMDHVDERLPGRVHRLIYEDLIESPEQEVRRLLDYLGLPFDPATLRFHENRRAVRTASSEQVRRPINRDGLDRWRDYEPWLAPLEAALGPALTGWRGKAARGA
ncbi:MAG TPA: sulfotransferase [Allosphingosinicella sp.]|jgi:tetratricopeptide (TPR) repeat protein